jgi:hypothetical protein
MKAAATFYRELFGWDVAGAGKLGDEYLVLRTSERPDSLGGALVRRPEGQYGATFFVLVESLDASTKRLEELGGTVTQPRTPLPGVGWIVAARDPQGNGIGLFEADEGAA